MERNHRNNADPIIPNQSIPVGISDFEKIRTGGFAYVDKTGLIADLLETRAEVTLFSGASRSAGQSRPRWQDPCSS